jgi:hypothetical protein
LLSEAGDLAHHGALRDVRLRLGVAGARLQVGHLAGRSEDLLFRILLGGHCLASEQSVHVRRLLHQIVLAGHADHDLLLHTRLLNRASSQLNVLRVDLDSLCRRPEPNTRRSRVLAGVLQINNHILHQAVGHGRHTLLEVWVDAWVRALFRPLRLDHCLRVVVVFELLHYDAVVVRSFVWGNQRQNLLRVEVVRFCPLEVLLVEVFLSHRVRSLQGICVRRRLLPFK